MHIIVEEKPKVEVYNVGDIISLKSGLYFIYKDPGTNKYHLISDNLHQWGNGTWDNLEDMIRNVKGNPHFQHYPKDEYSLKLIKKK